METGIEKLKGFGPAHPANAGLVDALHDAAPIASPENQTSPPLTTILLLAAKRTRIDVGGGGATAVTTIVVDAVAVPPGPVHVIVTTYVPMASPERTCEPETLATPDHAVVGGFANFAQVVVPVEDQTTLVVPPTANCDGVAEIVAVGLAEGGGATFVTKMVVEAVAVPPGPAHAIVTV